MHEITPCNFSARRLEGSLRLLVRVGALRTDSDDSNYLLVLNPGFTLNRHQQAKTFREWQKGFLSVGDDEAFGAHPQQLGLAESTLH